MRDASFIMRHPTDAYGMPLESNVFSLFNIALCSMAVQGSDACHSSWHLHENTHMRICICVYIL